MEAGTGGVVSPPGPSAAVTDGANKYGKGVSSLTDRITDAQSLAVSGCEWDDLDSTTRELPRTVGLAASKLPEVAAGTPEGRALTSCPDGGQALAKTHPDGTAPAGSLAPAAAGVALKPRKYQVRVHRPGAA
jgi:hypothetical protein